MSERYELSESAKTLLDGLYKGFQKALKDASEDADRAVSQYFQDYAHEDTRQNILIAANRVIEEILEGKSWKTDHWASALYDSCQKIRDRIWEARADEIMKASLEMKDKRIAFLEDLLERERRYR